MPEAHDPSLRMLTCEGCVSLLDDLRRNLAETDLNLEEMALWQDLEDLRWLATQRGNVLQGYENLKDPTRKRRIQGFRDAVFIKRSVKAIERTRNYEGWRQPAIHLRNWRLRDIPEDEGLAGKQAQQSMDFLYEIEVAARLGFTFSKIKFAEPDLVIESPDLPIAWSIACKRPRSLNSMTRATRKAVMQIDREGRLGVVMVSLDNLLGDGQKVIDLSGAPLRPIYQDRMTRIVESCSKALLAELEDSLPLPADPKDPKAGRGVLGILTTGWFFLLGKDGPAGQVYLNTRMEPSMINRNEPKWAQAAVYFLLQCLEQADRQLRSNY